MKIILLQDVRNVGKNGDVKDVKDGYARNFLFVNNLAKPATAGAMKELDALKSKLKENEEEFKKHVAELLAAIKGKSLEFFLRADESGTIFGSVTKEMILNALRDSKLIDKERVEIELDRPIKELGEKKIPLRFRGGQEGEIGIIIRPQD